MKRLRLEIAVGLRESLSPVRRPVRTRITKTERGFTLIELLVVFTILALLLTLATPRYLKTLEGGKTKVQAQNMATLRDAIDKFRADQGRYPSQLEELVVKQYLRQIPLDPVSGTLAWGAVPPPNVGESGIYDVKVPNFPGTSPLTEGSSDVQPGSAPNELIPSPNQGIDGSSGSVGTSVLSQVPALAPNRSPPAGNRP